MEQFQVFRCKPFFRQKPVNVLDWLNSTDENHFVRFLLSETTIKSKKRIVITQKLTWTQNVSQDLIAVCKSGSYRDAKPCQSGRKVGQMGPKSQLPRFNMCYFVYNYLDIEACFDSVVQSIFGAMSEGFEGKIFCCGFFFQFAEVSM